MGILRKIFGKRTEVTAVPTESFEAMRARVSAERRAILEKAEAEHGSDPRYKRYVDYCRYFYNEAEYANNKAELMDAMRLTSPACYLPRASRS